MTLIDMIRRIVSDIVTGRAKFSVSPWWIWKCLWKSPGERAGFFRNKPGIIGFRWGFYILGFEYGCRDGVTAEDRRRNVTKHECEALIICERDGDIVVDVVDCFCKTCGAPMNVPDSFWREQDEKNKPPPEWEDAP